MHKRLSQSRQGGLPAALFPALQVSLLVSLLAPCLAVAASAQISTTSRPLIVDPVPTIVLDYDRDGVDEVISSFETYQGLAAYTVGESGKLIFERALGDSSNTPNQLALADMDGDGVEDMVALEPDFLLNGLALVFYFDRGGPLFEFQSTSILVRIGDRVAPVDFDGDGDMDVVLYPNDQRASMAAAAPSSTIRWVENAGGGSFLAPQSIMSFPELLRSALPLDLDQDGDLDFVAIRQTSGTLVLLRNVGQLLQVEALPQSLTDYADLQVGDVNGDGLNDVIALRGGVSTIEPVRVERYLGTAIGALGGPSTVFLGSSNLLQTMSLVDADGDSDLDLALTSSGTPGTTHRIWLSDGDGLGSFGPASLTSEAPGQVWSKAQVGDFDGDGRGDLLQGGAATTGIVATIRRGTLDGAGAGFLQGVTHGLVRRGRRTTVCDLDGDAVNDLVLQIGTSLLVWARGLPDGSGFDNPATMDADGTVLLTANLDGDAADELVVVRGSSNDVAILDDFANGEFGSEVALGLLGTPFKGLTVRVVDLDGDGDLDLTAEGDLDNDLLWFENMGSLNFAPAVALGLGVATESFTFDHGDFNGDGRVDVLTKYLTVFPELFESYSWHEGLGGAVFGPRQIVGAGGSETLIIDLDGDGADDLVWPSGSSPRKLSWTPGGPAGLEQSNSVELVASIEEFNLLGVADFDGDGVSDLLVNSTQARIVGYRGLGAGPTFSGVGVELAPEGAEGGTNPYTIQLVDVGSDADLDVVISSVNEKRRWHENTGNGLVGSSYCGPAVPNSTGVPSRIFAAGSSDSQANALALRVADVPRFAFGFFIVSQTQVPATPVIMSSGRICLGGLVGRYIGPGEVQSSGSTGTFALDLDLTAIPQPNGFVQAAPGSTWSFQAWNRDSVAGNVTSNFSDGVQVTLQ